MMSQSIVVTGEVGFGPFLGADWPVRVSEAVYILFHLRRKGQSGSLQGIDGSRVSRSTRFFLPAWLLPAPTK